MKLVDLDLQTPNLAAQWMMGNLSTLLAELGDRWPRCAPLLTDEVAIGLYLSQALYNLQTAADAEALRLQANAAMAQAFGEVDLIIGATNPGPAFPATSTTSNPEEDLIDRAKSSPIARVVFRGALMGTRVASSFAPKLPSNLLEYFSGKFPDMVNMGALTIISNIYGNPAVSIPAGTGRRPAGGHAGAGPPPPRRPALRRGPGRRARAPLAHGRPLGRPAGPTPPPDPAALADVARRRPARRWWCHAGEGPSTDAPAGGRCARHTLFVAGRGLSARRG